MTGRIKIGIFGCGAVTEMFHLPALLAREDLQITAAIDRNLERAELIADKAGAVALSNIQDAVHLFDAAIVALPHQLHESACIELLDAGKHVLVEKPMALSVTECDRMIAAATNGGGTLTVGQMRRFCPVVAAAKLFLDRGLLGVVQSFHIQEGNIFNWPTASDYFLKKETSGGGVLIDTGAHTLDMLLWLFGEVAEVEYTDDSFGGVEADCEIQLQTESGIRGYVELSRTRELPTELVIEGERGRMVVAYKPNQISLEIDGMKLETFSMPTRYPEGPAKSIWHLMIVRQLENWVASLKTGVPALVSGAEGRRVVDLIERCYQKRQPLVFPWVGSFPAGEKS
jgi:predicted dehydrogenase